MRGTTTISPAAIVWGGIVAGTLDIGAAIAIFRAGPITVMQSIASGLLGKQAYHGGLPVAMLGLALQWAMGMIIAAIFVTAARRLPVLLHRWIAAGLAYGAVTFIVMNYVVVPLSAAGHGTMPHFTPPLLVANLLSMFAFGLVIAWFAQRHASHLPVAT
jgi:hypothetical protein